jgi:hypothetical protein
MKHLLTICLAMPLFTEPVRAAACLPVEGEHIFGKDIAAASAPFAALDPAAEIGFSPRPGVVRVFQPAELATLARKFDIELKTRLESVCFVRPANAAAAQKTVAAKMDVLRGERVAVEVASGAALLRFLGDAETSGHVGDSVLVRNPENGKLFQAKVEGTGKVLVQR